MGSYYLDMRSHRKDCANVGPRISGKAVFAVWWQWEGSWRWPRCKLTQDILTLNACMFVRNAAGDILDIHFEILSTSPVLASFLSVWYAVLWLKCRCSRFVCVKVFWHLFVVLGHQILNILRPVCCFVNVSFFSIVWKAETWPSSASDISTYSVFGED